MRAQAIDEGAAIVVVGVTMADEDTRGGLGWCRHGGRPPGRTTRLVGDGKCSMSGDGEQPDFHPLLWRSGAEWAWYNPGSVGRWTPGWHCAANPARND